MSRIIEINEEYLKKLNTNLYILREDLEERLILYFKIPEKDGSFMLENARINENERDLYFVEFDALSKSGKLYFITEKYDRMAIKKLDSYLRPACEIQNYENCKTAKEIKIIESGKVSFNEGSLIVDKYHKIKIELI